MPPAPVSSQIAPREALPTTAVSPGDCVHCCPLGPRVGSARLALNGHQHPSQLLPPYLHPQDLLDPPLTSRGTFLASSRCLRIRLLSLSASSLLDLMKPEDGGRCGDSYWTRGQSRFSLPLGGITSGAQRLRGACWPYCPETQHRIFRNNNSNNFYLLVF